MSNSNEYMRIYMLKRYKERMASAIFHLGSKCKLCPEVNNLQLDHIDPKTKKFTIGKLWSINIKDFWIEVNKCQLLCASCYELKTLKDLGQTSAKTSHGTLSSYAYCKCVLCKKAQSDYCKQYRLNKKLGPKL